MSNLHLRYKELVVPRQPLNGTILRRILLPDYIPIHSRVFGNSEMYEPSFAEEVISKVPDSMRRDIKAIEDILKVGLGIEVHEDRCVTKRESFRDVEEYRDFRVRADSGDLWGISLTHNTSSMFVHCRSYNRPQIYKKDVANGKIKLNMPRDKIREYATSESPDSFELRSWSTNNIIDQGLGAQLYFRNFAIVFNNLGLDRG
jgi:hypothetical protein